MAYQNGSDSKKTAIVRELVGWVKNQKGRFLDLDVIGWYDVTEAASMDTIWKMVQGYKRKVVDEEDGSI